MLSIKINDGRRDASLCSNVLMCDDDDNNINNNNDGDGN